MTLEEFQHIIYTSDSRYAEHFDEYVAFYEFIKDRIPNTNIIENIDIKYYKKSTVFTVISNVNLEDISLSINNGEISLFGLRFTIESYMKDSTLIVKINKIIE